MPFQVSPGVNVSEIDLTTVVPAVSTTEGAIAGTFQWGPVGERILIDSEDRLVNIFGKPDADTANFFFTAANFLSYGNALYVVRATDTDALNAASGNTANVIVESEDYYNETLNGATALPSGFEWAAKYPGDKGNSIRVAVFPGGASNFASWDWAGYFGDAPASTEAHIAIIDEDGGISGVANTVLETYSGVSTDETARTEQGATNYYAAVINQQSPYIWVGDGADDLVSGTATANDLLAGGANGTAVTGDDLQSSYDLFKSAEDVDISFLLGAAAPASLANYLITTIAEDRKDCIAVISPERADVVNNASGALDDVLAFRTAVNTSSSYAVMDSGWKYMYDKYNDLYRYVPLNGDTAGLMVQTDLTRDPWWSPAGFNRGNIKNCIRLAWNPSKTDRDQLYKKGINPVVTFPGQGTVLFGDKTLLSKPSAFDRINVRRLFIVLEKAISTASKFTLFEFNDEFTRSQFRNLVEPFLRDVQGRRGITDFRVVCDSTNNTGEVIDRNEFVGDIYIKPARSINFIQLNFVAVRTGVEFSEVVGKF